MVDVEQHVARMTRRRMLTAATAGLVGAGLAGCTDTSDVPSGGGAPTTEASFAIQDPKTPLPSDPVSLRWMDSGDQKAYFFKGLFAAYQAKHDNVSITYDGSNWGQIQQVITLGIRNGTEPDVFQLPGSISIPTAVANGWIGSFDDIVPDLAEAKKRYPPGVFVNGITDFDSKTYAIPLVTGRRFNNLLMFNADYATMADVDPSQVMSWDDFRAMLQKITKQGAGKYFGLVMGLAADAHLSNVISVMAQMAGVAGGVAVGGNPGFDWRTGEMNFTNPLTAEALELFLAINSDQSFVPGSNSLDDAGARGRMPQGAAGVIFDGPWDIELWQTQNPGFHLGLGLPPQADPAAVHPMTYAPGGNGKWVYKAKTSASTVIGDIFAYITTPDAQVQWTKLDGAADPSPMTSAIDQGGLQGLSAQSVQIAEDNMVLGPEPAARNADVSKVYQALISPTPSFSDVCVGLITGQIDQSVKSALQGCQDRYNKAFDAAITQVRKRGGNVTRDDWMFSDWDPTKPYANY